MPAYKWTEEKVACLRRHWEARTPRGVIMKFLGFGWEAIAAKAEELGLGPPPPVNRRDEHVRTVRDLRHRFALGFADPVRLKPTAALFGPPLRTLDPATRALIDEALAARCFEARPDGRAPQHEGAGI